MEIKNQPIKFIFDGISEESFTNIKITTTDNYGSDDIIESKVFVTVPLYRHGVL